MDNSESTGNLSDKSAAAGNEPVSSSPETPKPAQFEQEDKKEPETETPISKEIADNWLKILIIGLYSLLVLFLTVFFLGSLMTVETDSNIVKCLKNNANANSNKPCPVPSPTATPVIAAAGNSATPAANLSPTQSPAANANQQASTPARTPANDPAGNAVTTDTPPAKPAETQDPGVINVVIPKEVYWYIPTPFAAIKNVISADSYLFFVVLFAGMLGGIVRAVYSYVKHLGLNDFSVKWLGYYFTLPYTGAALALIIYFVVRGGFGGTTFGTGLPFNPFSFAAMAALTGLFTENAMNKLKQVADTLLAQSTPKTTNAKEDMKENKKDEEGK